MRNEHLKALDGLRFLAAFAVMIGHGVWYLVLLQQPENMTPVASVIISQTNTGMTLFFVLSGFVIHFNYNNVLESSYKLRKFAVARWSRLYPLFFVVFAIQLVWTLRHRGLDANMAASLPFYLSFTQTWWFWIFDNAYSGDAYGGATGVMWSLSTEAFFYCAYPFVALPLIGRLRPRMAFAAMWPLGLLGAVLSCLAVAWRGEIAEWAIGFLQTPAASQFPHWLVYNSPWIRIFEFLMGALAAQIVLAGWRPSARVADAMALGSLLAIAVVFGPVCYYQLPYGANVTTCLAPFFALLCLSCAAPDSVFARILGSKPMVWGGESSYSLYLLHFWVLHVVALPRVAPLGYSLRIFWLIVAMIVAAAMARASFLLLERPSMRFLRNIALPRRETAVADSA